MKILIVDDSGTMRAIQKRMLADLGITDVTEAADGLLALQAVAATKFDVILMDWNMPNLSGIDALRRLKSDPAHRSVPVIMVTSESEKSHIMDAIKYGADNYVVKPFTAEVIKEKLKLYHPK